jgi:hypothetical protein
MDLVKEIRRNFIALRKRMALLRYNVNYKVKTQSIMNFQYDEENYFGKVDPVRGPTVHTMNLLNFESKKDFYLVDPYTDSSEFGGLSEVDLTHNLDEGYLKVEARLKKDTQGLELPFDAMFGGFQCFHLSKKEYYMYNGLRITMKPPTHPCKVGIHLKVNFGSEYEHFVGYIVDTNN